MVPLEGHNRLLKSRNNSAIKKEQDVKVNVAYALVAKAKWKVQQSTLSIYSLKSKDKKS